MEGKSSAMDADLPNKRRGSDASLTGIKYTKLEPPKRINEGEVADKPKEWKPTRPRRERTDGDIMLRRSRQELKENLQARRLDVEMRFSKEAEKMKNRKSRILVSQQNAVGTGESDELTQVSTLLFA